MTSETPLPRRPPLDERRLRQRQAERSCPRAIASRTIGLLQTVHDLLPEALEPSATSPTHGSLNGLDIVCRALGAALSLYDAMALPEDPVRLEAGRHQCVLLLDLCSRLPRKKSAEQIEEVLAAESDLGDARATLHAIARGDIVAVAGGVLPDPFPARSSPPPPPLLRRVAQALSLVLPSEDRSDWIEERISDLHRLSRRRQIGYVVQMLRAAPVQAVVMRRNNREAA